MVSCMVTIKSTIALTGVSFVDGYQLSMPRISQEERTYIEIIIQHDNTTHVAENPDIVYSYIAIPAFDSFSMITYALPEFCRK